MRRTAPYLAAWFAAGVAAVLLASAGVSLVTRHVTSDRPAPLDADQVRQELATAQDRTGTTTTTTTTSPSASSTTVSPGSSGGPVTTVAPNPVAGDDGPGAGPPPPTTVAGPTATTRTYDLVGGTLTLRYHPDGVQVLVATPRAGFTVKAGTSHSNGVQVEFRSDSHRSRVDGWWDAGPRDEVREED